LDEELELQLELEFELELEDEFEELLDELFEDEFELEFPATRVRGASSVTAGLAAVISTSSGGVRACAAPMARAAVAAVASAEMVTVFFIPSLLPGRC
jgi:hypothetical protein